VKQITPPSNLTSAMFIWCDENMPSLALSCGVGGTVLSDRHERELAFSTTESQFCRLFIAYLSVSAPKIIKWYATRCDTMVSFIDTHKMIDFFEVGDLKLALLQSESSGTLPYF
jgi:hypothetical protein